MTEKLKNPFKITELINAVNSLVDEKQDLISDLSTIRSGAALGATALQSITSSNVTTALGYTPYDSTNPNGYITNSALTPYVSSVNNINPVNGNVTLSIPTVNNPTITFTQGGTTKGTFTLNQSTNETIELDAGSSGSSYTAGDGIDITNNVIKVTNNISTGAALGTTAVQPTDLANVATSGNYNDLSNKPTIPAAQINADWDATSGVAQILNKPTIPAVPTNVSEFTNDVGYITNSALNGYATESYVTTATINMQTTNNLVTLISSSSTDTQYPSAKCVYDIVGDIESTLDAIIAQGS